MLIKPSKKEEAINLLNNNYRTLLSYGEDNTLIPVGEFIVKDIKENEIPKEYADSISEIEIASIILQKIDDENTEIILPMEVFLSKYLELAVQNAEELCLGYNPEIPIEIIIKNATEKVMNSEEFNYIMKAKAISLNESNSEYLINGKLQSSNYSIIPVDLGKYRERMKEHYDEPER